MTRNQYLIVTLLCVTLIPGIASSSPWDFGTTIDLGIVKTDNIFLESDELKQDETVYMIRPEFSLTKDSERLQADLNYRPEAYFYQEFDESDNIFHVLDATLTGALIREKLFVYLSASNFQTIVNPSEQIPPGNLPISNNRVDSRVFEVKPYWDQRLGKADLLLEAAYITADYDDELLQGNEIVNGRFELDNTDRQEGLAWGVEYQYVRSEYEFSDPWVYQRASAMLGYWVNGTLRIFGSGGAETPLDNLEEKSLEDDFYEFGVQYVPNSRLNIEFATGERYYGPSYRGAFRFDMRRGNTSLTYSESPSTDAQLPTDRRPITDGSVLDGILDQPGRSDRFVLKRGDWNTSLEFSKSQLFLQLFTEERTDRIAADGTALGDEEYSGINATWTWNLGNNTDIALGANMGRWDRDDGASDFRGFRGELGYRMFQRVSVRLGYGHSKQDSREPAGASYTENQYRLFLRTEF